MKVSVPMNVEVKPTAHAHEAIAAMGSNIVSGFPGIGKSTVFRDERLRVADSDSSTFDKTQFPANYIEHIQKTAPTVDYILVSSHDVVRAALVEQRMPFVLVYPSRDQKTDYLKRYVERGSPAAFIKLMDEKWDDFLSQCEKQTGCIHLVLQPGQYLADVIYAQ